MSIEYSWLLEFQSPPFPSTVGLLEIARSKEGVYSSLWEEDPIETKVKEYGRYMMEARFMRFLKKPFPTRHGNMGLELAN